MNCARLFLVCWTMAAMALTSAVASEPPKVNPKAAELKEFNDRVAKYLGIHRKADAAVPSLKKTDDPVEISSREKMLGDMIREFRKDAKQGDIFTLAVAQQFRQIIRNDVKRRGPAAAHAMMTEVPPGYQPKINATYPSTQPLATVPPLLIAALQPLPEEVEYRFFGRTLILRDVKANIIVDFVPDAIPASTK
jgi:hypothetical protein